MKPIIECIRDFVMTFPELKDGCLMIDYLGDKAIEYSIEAVPCDRIFRHYTDGGCMKQFMFVFASREFYSADVNQCIENSAFYENFENWVLDTDNETLNRFLDGRDALGLKIMSGNYLFSSDFSSARYQIQLRLLYED